MNSKQVVFVVLVVAVLCVPVALLFRWSDSPGRLHSIRTELIQAGRSAGLERPDELLFLNAGSDLLTANALVGIRDRRLIVVSRYPEVAVREVSLDRLREVEVVRPRPGSLIVKVSFAPNEVASLWARTDIPAAERLGRDLAMHLREAH